MMKRIGHQEQSMEEAANHSNHEKEKRERVSEWERKVYIERKRKRER